MNKKDFNKILLSILCLCLSFTVSATTFTVNTTNDTNDATPGDGTCADASGNCSIRAALEEANATMATDIINVPAGTYTLTLGTELVISSNLTLSGADKATTIIQAATTAKTATSRVLFLDDSDNFPDKNFMDITVEGFTIRNGYVDGHGGGILVDMTTSNPGHDSNRSKFVFRNLIVDNNHTHTNAIRDGGGMYVQARWYRTMKFENCTFSNNSTLDEGGGLSFRGKAAQFLLIECQFNNNHAGDSGGGVFHHYPATPRPTMFIRCGFFLNTAVNKGGGIYTEKGRHVFINSTIAENTAGLGGGVYSGESTLDTLNILNCTIAKNIATTTNGGGGIYIGGDGLTGGFTMDNTIVWGNTADNIAHDLHVEAFFYNSTIGAIMADLPATNIVGVATENDATYDYPNAFITTDPNLGVLARCSSNSIPTYDFSAGSSADDAGNSSFSGFPHKNINLMAPFTQSDIPYSTLISNMGTAWTAMNFDVPNDDVCETTRVGNPDIGSYEVETGALSVLPVELVSFKAQRLENEKVMLSWQTATEKNNEGFDIQHSTDGENWENIGFVQGYGTTQEVQEYTFIDETPFIVTNYYRLKQMDYDGQFEYSNIVNITIQQYNNSAIQIFPNPVQNELNIVNGEGQATIYNTLGQPIQQFAVGSGQFTVNTRELAKGQYILHILQQNGDLVIKLFVK